MKLGYVHLGPAEHGVSRYGRLLAEEARRRRDLDVLEREVLLTGDTRADAEAIARSARALARADVVHLQYNSQIRGCVWGPTWWQFVHVAMFTSFCSTRCVATLHDIYARPSPGWRWRVRHPVAEGRRELRDAPQVATLGWIQRHTSRLFVCTNEERSRLTAVRDRIAVIPHFVERRDLELTPDAAKRQLGLDGRRVVTLLGYIHRRKGHVLLLDALARLPRDVVGVFAGGFTEAHRQFVDELHRQSDLLGLRHRVRITGYLPEAALNVYLAATDVAVCPFERLSASSSLSTWISAARPILASDLPQISEYRVLEPDAIEIFRPYDADALARTMEMMLASRSDRADAAVARLQHQLRIPAIFDQHLHEYRIAMNHIDPMSRWAGVKPAAD
jgi:glycosyltransferase involved in cell wall biosynthesis